jgi:hypothetical protein
VAILRSLCRSLSGVESVLDVAFSLMLRPKPKRWYTGHYIAQYLLDENTVEMTTAAVYCS